MHLSHCGVDGEAGSVGAAATMATREVRTRTRTSFILATGIYQSELVGLCVEDQGAAHVLLTNEE